MIDANSNASGPCFDRGWFPFSRELRDHPIMTNSLTLWVYIELGLRARFLPRVERVPGTTVYLNCNTGECVCGRKELAIKIGVGERRIRTALDRLVRWGLISTKGTRQGSIVTLLGIRRFWEKNREQRPTADQRKAQPKATRGPVTDTGKPENGDKGKRDTDSAPDPCGRGRPSRPLAEIHTDQRLARQVHLLQKAWERFDARIASFTYLLDAIGRHPDGDEFARKMVDEPSLYYRELDGAHLFSFVRRVVCPEGAVDDVRAVLEKNGYSETPVASLESLDCG